MLCWTKILLSLRVLGPLVSALYVSQTVNYYNEIPSPKYCRSWNTIHSMLYFQNWKLYLLRITILLIPNDLSNTYTMYIYVLINKAINKVYIYERWSEKEILDYEVIRYYFLSYDSISRNAIALRTSLLMVFLELLQGVPLIQFTSI